MAKARGYAGRTKLMRLRRKRGGKTPNGEPRKRNTHKNEVVVRVVGNGTYVCVGGREGRRARGQVVIWMCVRARVGWGVGGGGGMVVEGGGCHDKFQYMVKKCNKYDLPLLVFLFIVYGSEQRPTLFYRQR